MVGRSLVWWGWSEVHHDLRLRLMYAVGLPRVHPNADSSTSIGRSSDCIADGETIRALPERWERRRLRLRLLGLRKHLMLLLCHLGLHLMSQ